MILFDFPFKPTEFLRRVGRTGRAGRPGKATILVYGKQVEAAKAVMKASIEGKRINTSDEADDMRGVFDGWGHRRGHPRVNKVDDDDCNDEMNEENNMAILKKRSLDRYRSILKEHCETKYNKDNSLNKDEKHKISLIKSRSNNNLRQFTIDASGVVSEKANLISNAVHDGRVLSSPGHNFWDTQNGRKGDMDKRDVHRKY